MSSDIASQNLQFQQAQRNALVRAYALTRSAMLHEFDAVMQLDPKPTGFTWQIDGRPQIPNDTSLRGLEDGLHQELADFDRRASSR